MKTEQILNVLRVGAWVAFFSSIVSLLFVVVVLARDLTNSSLGRDTVVNFSGINLSITALRANYLKEFIFLMSFGIVLGLVHVQIWWKVKEVLTKVNLTTPFSIKIALLLERVAYLLLMIWIISIIGDGYTQWLSNKVANTAFHLKFNTEFSYLFSAGIVYVVSQVYKRGAEMQEDIDYTV